MWLRPRPRTPTQATRTVSLGLARALGLRAVLAAKEPIKKYLRSISPPRGRNAAIDPLYASASANRHHHLLAFGRGCGWFQVLHAIQRLTRQIGFAEFTISQAKLVIRAGVHGTERDRAPQSGDRLLVAAHGDINFAAKVENIRVAGRADFGLRELGQDGRVI